MPGVLAHWLVAQEVALQFIDKNKNGRRYFEFKDENGDYIDKDDMVKVIDKEKSVLVSREMESTVFYDMQKNQRIENDIYISKYVYLGANGPDLPYFHDLDLIGKILRKAGKSKWADYLHYNKQAEFLLELSSLIKNLNDEEIQARLLGYALGYATHMAADSIVHPYVNLFAGVYHNQVYEDIHRISECHQDSWLAHAYFGREYIDEGPSWRQYLIPHKIRMIHPVHRVEVEAVNPKVINIFGHMDKTIQNVYNESPGRSYLEISYGKFYKTAIEDYDIAFVIIPKQPNLALVQHKSLQGTPDYTNYTRLLTNKAVEAAFNACERIIILFETLKKIDKKSINDTEKEAEQEKVKNIFRSKLKNYNMDTGYRIEVSKDDNGLPRIIWRHSWCEE